MMDLLASPVMVDGDYTLLRSGLLLVSLLAAVIYLFINARPASTFRLVIKCLAVGPLALYVLALLPDVSLTVSVVTISLLVLGLIFSTLGDGFLAVGSNKTFTLGLGAFLIGHLFYVALFLAFLPDPFNMLDAEGAGAGLIFVVAIGLFHWLRPDLGKMQLPVAFYILAISLMAMTSLLSSLPVSVVIGALLFMASDLMIGVERFKGGFPGSRPAIWITYYLAQWQIAFGSLSVMLAG